MSKLLVSSFTNSFYFFNTFSKIYCTATVLLLYWQYRAVRAGVGTNIEVCPMLASKDPSSISGDITSD